GVPAQLVLGDGGPGNLIIVNGGSLVTSNYAGVNSFNAIGYSSLARLEIAAGGSMIISNHLWVAQNFGATATFVMNGGTATVLGMFGVGWNGGANSGRGIVLINGGTLNLAKWNDANSFESLAHLEFRAGAVMIHV